MNYPILEHDPTLEAFIEPSKVNQRQVVFGQALYGGDDLSGTDWDNRERKSAKACFGYVRMPV